MNLARVPNLAPVRKRRPEKQRSAFFAPIFSFFSTTNLLRSFKLWPGGGSAVAPMNLARSWGGIDVTPELSLSISAVWSCVWRYANTISTLPLMLMQTGAQNSATVAGKHPLYTLLHDRPNGQMSAAKFWQSMIASMLVWGSGYARKLKVGDKLVGLKPMRPEYVTAYLDDQGNLRYRYWPSSGTDKRLNEDLPADDVFVLMDRSIDGLSGLSRIEYARDSLGLSIAADRASGLAYKNGLRASGILTIAQWLKPDQREAYRAILAEFMGTGTGESTDKQGGVLVAENATKFEALSMKPQDVELLASRRYSVEDICRWFDVPPILIHHAAEGVTAWGTGIEQIILGWFKLGLAPILRTVEQEIWRQLLTPAEQGSGLFAEFNIDALLRGDSKGRAEMYSAMAQNGVYTRNEIRARENLPPVVGGDVLTVQSNLLPIDKLGQVQPAPGGGTKLSRRVTKHDAAGLPLEVEESMRSEGRVVRRLRRVTKVDADGVPLEAEEIEVVHE